jgi:hypothetical protein
MIASSELNFTGKSNSEIQSTHWLRTLVGWYTRPGNKKARRANLSSDEPDAFEIHEANVLPSLNFTLPSLNSLPICSYLSWIWLDGYGYCQFTNPANCQP